MKKLFKKYKKTITGILLLIILIALGYWTYLSYQNSSFVKEKDTTDTNQTETSPVDTPSITQPENSKIDEPTDLSTFKITNIDRGSTLTGAAPIKVFVPTGGYSLSVTINSDKWGEIFSTSKDNVSGEVPITYSFNQAVASGQSGNVRAILLKGGVEVARDEIWVNF